MYYFKTRTAARNFKNGRDGYQVKDLGAGHVYRWAVQVVCNPLLKDQFLGRVD